MDKIAQRRGLLNKLRETVNAPGRYLKKVFDPEYGDLMDKLKLADNTFRAIASGESIDGVEPGDDPVAIKTLLKDARSRFNRREYLVSASLLGRVHKKFDDIVAEAKKFKLDFEKVHNRFLFAPFEDYKDKRRDEHIEHLQKLRQRLGTQEHPAYFIKEAGIWDQVHNLFTNRGRALAAWEKRYPQKVKEIRNGAESLLNQAEGLQSRLLDALKLMATARAKSDMNEYVRLVDMLAGKTFSDFDIKFKDYYSKVIKPAVDSQAMFQPQKPETKVELPKDQSKEMGSQDVSAPSSGGGPTPPPSPGSPGSSGTPTQYQPPASGVWTPSPSGASNIPIPLVNKKQEPSSLPFAATMPSPRWSTPPAATQQVGPPSHMDSTEFLQNPVFPQPPKLPTNVGPVPSAAMPDTARADDLPVAAQHQQFYSVLSKMGSEHPLVLSAFVRKYAQSIRSNDPETAIQLFAIAKQLKE